MQPTFAPVRVAALAPARTDEEHQLHLAALEWGLTDPIIIESADDLQSRPSWSNEFKPYQHQVQNLITFCRRLPVILLADDVGLGKTISAGLILSELMTRRRVRRALVLAPKILGDQWCRELGDHFNIGAEVVTGDELMRAGRTGQPVVVTTYHSATGRLEQLPTDAFDMLILDEAHKLRNLHGSSKPPLMAKAVIDALRQRRFRFVIMLTATPIQNSLLDLYSLADYLCVAKGHRNPFGERKQFIERYLAKNSGNRRLANGMVSEFRDRWRELMVRTRRNDAKLLFPIREVRNESVALTTVELKLLHLIAQLPMIRVDEAALRPPDKLQQHSLCEALMSSPQALVRQLEQSAVKNSDLDDSLHHARKLLAICPQPAKLQRLLALCNFLRNKRPVDWRMVVFTRRLETQNLIGEAMRAHGIGFRKIAGSQPLLNARAAKEFCDDPPRFHVIVSTDAGAEGINLQSANVLVNYDLPWNPMVLEQRIGRVQRLGSKHATVQVWNLVADKTFEQQIVARLQDKLIAVNQSLGDVASVLSVTDDDEGDNFKETIRKLVVASLRGVDTEAELKLKENSIEAAWSDYRESHAIMDATLGNLRDRPQTGPTLPKFSRHAHRISARDFVLRCKRAECGEVREDGQGVFRTLGGSNERFTFDAEVAADCAKDARFNSPVTLYVPGKPAFERLVQQWTTKAAHRLREAQPTSELQLETASRAWCESLEGVEYRKHRRIAAARHFQGDLLSKATASTGVDRYETLVKTCLAPANHRPIPTPATIDYQNLADLTRDVALPAEQLTAALREDPGVAAFANYYAARLATELDHAGSDPARCSKVLGDFAVAVHAELVSASGTMYESVIAEVDYAIRGEGNYMARLRLVPASGQILEMPTTSRCAATDAIVPSEILQSCEMTGDMVARHMLRESPSGRQVRRDRFGCCQKTQEEVPLDELGRSEMSGRLALKGLLVRCEVSGDLVLPDEMNDSAVSGRRVRCDLLVASPKSGRMGLSDEFGTCVVSHARMLIDELAKSAVSGQLADKDLLIVSDRTGNLGLPSEIVRCVVSGANLLLSETAVCEITNQRVDTALLSHSAVSGRLVLRSLLKPSAKSAFRLGLAEELATCQVTGRQLLRDELAASAVSGKLADRDLMAISASGLLALPDELETCAVTGKKALPHELVACAASGQHALPEAMVVCSWTNDRIMPAAADRSAVSGRLVRRDLLKPSVKPPFRLGLADEIIECGISGRQLLRDEVAKSAVSGTIADRDLMVVSAASGLFALPSEIVTCAETGETLLPTEVGQCSITNRVVNLQLLAQSDVSGRLGLFGLLKRCAVSGKLALPNELETCTITGKRVLLTELAACTASNRLALPNAMIVCARTGDRITPAAAARSAISGLLVRRDLLVSSAKPPHRMGLPDEMARCHLTGQLLLRDELFASAVSKKMADCDLMATSVSSGLLGRVWRIRLSGRAILPLDARSCRKDSHGRVPELSPDRRSMATIGTAVADAQRQTRRSI